MNPLPKLFDSHAHVFTGDTARYPIDVSNAKESPEALIQRIRDNPIDEARLLAEMDTAGVGGATAVQYNSIYKTDNSYMLDVVDANPGRLSAILILDAQRPETPERLAELARTYDVVGLRLFGFPGPDEDFPWFDSPAAHRTWAAAAEAGIAVDMMYVPAPPTPNVIGRIVALAKRFPDLPILLDHCGWPHVDRGEDGAIGPELLETRDVRNIQFKFTGINFNRFAPTDIDPARFLRRMIDIFGAERVMWGSDFGNTKESYADLVTMAIGATSLLSEDERAAVLHDNGRRVLGPRR